MPAEPAPAARPVAAARRRRLRADQARQLADLLRHQILADGFPGGVLPLEDVIAADYRASRNTVRQALDLLRGEQAPLDPLLDDPDPLVRGAALRALADTGCPPPYAARAAEALRDPAWQVRAGAAAALRAAPPSEAVPALARTLADPNADVRKAAVLSLLAHRGVAEARTALATATADPDADVRAYASRAAS